ncbi:hypothetical protein [Clostridium tunisiense]|uniref:hypothetical protein n=1 Tax=Clostridium tunisiense TaxID=219748 RepID=UPI00030AF0A5|nr:hypothetical protein [Clostridium tunisiense]
MSEENKFNNGKEHVHCKEDNEVKVLECDTIVKCRSKQYNIDTSKNAFIVNVPIVLAGIEIELTLDKEIELGENKTYVRAESKHTMITECNIIPYTNNLFVEGYVQKYIEFYESRQIGLPRKELKHMTINIPFKAFTEVSFLTKPIYGKTINKSICVMKNIELAKGTTENSWFYYNKPQEQIYCELEWLKILETNILENSIKENMSNNEECKNCRKLFVKMVLNIGLKIIQNQPLAISHFDKINYKIEDKSNIKEEKLVEDE